MRKRPAVAIPRIVTKAGVMAAPGSEGRLPVNTVVKTDGPMPLVNCSRAQSELPGEPASSDYSG